MLRKWANEQLDGNILESGPKNVPGFIGALVAGLINIEFQRPQCPEHDGHSASMKSQENELFFNYTKTRKKQACLH